MDDAREKRPRVTFVGDLSKLTDELRGLSKFKLPASALTVKDVPPAPRYVHPSVKTTAAVEKVNHHTETLVRAMLELIAVTTAEAESVRSSNRLLIRLAVGTMILTGLVAALTLVLVLR